jgi:GTP cyclohydrolase I
MDAIDTLTYPFTAPRVLEPRGESMVRGLIEEIGEDPEREGLVRTPHRVWESLSFLTDGYEGDVMDVVGDAVFAEAHDEMVVVRDIEFYSLCEHHMLPFFGVCHVAYIPDGRIIGLSKIPRVVDLFSHRLQVQERLTTQIADGLDEALQPKGLGVVLEASHLCMMMRGVEKQSSRTATSAMRGLFRSDPQARGEFLNLIKGS